MSRIYKQGKGIVGSNKSSGTRRRHMPIGGNSSCNNVGDSCTHGYDSTIGWTDCTPNGGVCDCNLNCIDSSYGCDDFNGSASLCGQGNIDTTCDYFCGIGGGGGCETGWIDEYGVCTT